MKKYILLLLLATFGMQAQTLQNPTYGNVKLKNNTQSTTATKVNVQETDGTINTISKSDLVNVVDVNDVHSLPLVGEVGKIYVVKNLNKIYRWNGTYYTELAITDISGKVDKVTGKSLLSDTEITRLATLSNYTHPANHPPSIITQDASNRFVTDAEKTAWNAKQSNLGYTPENVANKSSTLTASSTLYPNNDAVIAGLALKEDKVNKVTSISLSANDTNYPSELAVKTYADNLVVGMLNDRGTWDASGNVFPTTGGSGVGGVIRKGDMWYVSVAGTLGTKSVNVGDSFRALVNNPAQVAANWSILEANIGYVPANDSNVVHLTGSETITGVKSFALDTSFNGVKVGRGSGNVASNTVTGANTLFSNTTGNYNTAAGLSALFSNTTGDYNIATGVSAGRFIANKTTPATILNKSIMLGCNTSPLADNQTNQTVIGHYATGLGSNTTVLGNSETTQTWVGGRLTLGSTTDDGINRIQVTGTASSGTTTLGDTQPTANNQLTRKDYVDSGLALKANLNGVVTLAGNQAINGNKTFNETTIFDGTGISANFRKFIIMSDGTLTSNTYSNIALGSLNGNFGIASSGFGRALLSTSNIGTTARTFTFPNQNGTFALTSDLSFYEPSFAKNTAFNKNFGTTAGTVVEGGTLGTNAYTSTAYQPILTNPVTGIGTTNYIAKFTSSGTVGNSIISDNGSEVSVNGDVVSSSVFRTKNSSIGGMQISKSTTGLFWQIGVGLAEVSENLTFSNSEGTISLRINQDDNAINATGTVSATSYTATSLPVFENNAAASSLAVGQFYRTSTGILMVKF